MGRSSDSLRKEYEYNIKWLSSLPFKILWVQGNYEYYHMMKDFPLEEWNWGMTRHVGTVVLMSKKNK